MSKDHQAEPRVGQRVPYVIVHGTPGLPLIQLVRQPQELLLDPELRLNGTYYVTKQVLPPLARVFSLIGIDVFAWYTQLPKTVRVMPPAFYNEQNKKVIILMVIVVLTSGSYCVNIVETVIKITLIIPLFHYGGYVTTILVYP